MAIIRDTKFHMWIQQNDKYIEHLRLDYEQSTGNPMEFDTWVEHFYHQSKATGQELPTRAELLYMCWLADNRTLLGVGHAKDLNNTEDQKAISRYNYEMYVKTEQGEKPLSDFISA